MSLAGTTTPIFDAKKLSLPKGYGKTQVQRFVVGLINASNEECAPYARTTNAENYLNNVCQESAFFNNFAQIVEELEKQFDHHQVPYKALFEQLLNVTQKGKSTSSANSNAYAQACRSAHDGYTVGLQKAKLCYELLKIGIPLLESKLPRSKLATIKAKMLINHSKDLPNVIFHLSSFLTIGVMDIDLAYTHFQMLLAHSTPFFEYVEIELDILRSLIERELAELPKKLAKNDKSFKDLKLLLEGQARATEDLLTLYFQRIDILTALITIRRFYALNGMRFQEEMAKGYCEKILAHVKKTLKTLEPLSLKKELKDELNTRYEALNQQFIEPPIQKPNSQIVAYFHKLHAYNEGQLTSAVSNDAVDLEDHITAMRRGLIKANSSNEIEDSIFTDLYAILTKMKNVADKAKYHKAVSELLGAACHYYMERIKLSSFEGKLFISLLREISDNHQDGLSQLLQANEQELAQKMQALSLSPATQSTSITAVSSAVTSSAVTSSAVTPSATTPSAVTPSAVTPSAVTPSAATPSAVTPSAATPSAVTPSATTSSTAASEQTAIAEIQTSNIRQLEEEHAAKLAAIEKEGKEQLAKQKADALKDYENKQKNYKKAQEDAAQQIAEKNDAEFTRYTNELKEKFEEAQIKHKEKLVQDRENAATAHSEMIADLDAEYDTKLSEVLAKIDKEVKEGEVVLQAIRDNQLEKITKEKAEHLARKEAELVATKTATQARVEALAREEQTKLAALKAENDQELINLKNQCAQTERRALEIIKKKAENEAERAIAQHTKKMHEIGTPQQREAYALNAKVVETVPLPLIIKKELRDLQGKVPFYIVGGSVRKKLLNRLSEKDDYDVMVDATREEVIKILGEYCHPDEKEEKLVKIIGTNIELWCEPWTGLATDVELQADPLASIKKSLSKRDFTIGAFMWSYSGQIFDVLGHKADLEADEVKLLGNLERLGAADQFDEKGNLIKAGKLGDFSLAMRWVRIATEYNKKIPDQALEYIRANIAHIKSIPFGRYCKNIKSLFVNKRNIAVLNLIMKDELMMLFPLMPIDYKTQLNTKFPYLKLFWMDKLHHMALNAEQGKWKQVLALFLLLPILIDKSKDPSRVIESIINDQQFQLIKEFKVSDAYSLNKITEMYLEIQNIYPEYQGFQLEKMTEQSVSALDSMAYVSTAMPLLSQYQNQPTRGFIPTTAQSAILREIPSKHGFK